MRNQDFSRTRRIADQIGREVATLLVEEIEDRRVRSVTVSGVDVSPDKRVATIYVSLPVDAPVDETMKALKRASSLLRRGLAKRIRIKYLPELRFVYDSTLDRVDRIEQLLREQLGPDSSPDGHAEAENDDSKGES
ncbi:MAG: ribosome-binding factor A [Gammaproteobacteria bacterium]|jgi:ribosome-binding factor A